MKALLRSHTSSSSSAANSSSSSSISSSPPQQPHSSWNHIRARFIVSSSNPSSAFDRGTLKSPWSRRKRKHALSQQQWDALFTEDGKLRDGGIKFLKKVRSGGVDPSIRAEVWPFLLGVYDLNSSKTERDSVRKEKRREYKKLRRRSRHLFKLRDEREEIFDGSACFDDGPETPFEEDFSSRNSPSIDEKHNDNYIHSLYDIRNISNSVRLEERSVVTNADASAMDSESSDSECSSIEDYESGRLPSLLEEGEEMSKHCESSIKMEPHRTVEDFPTWRRIIRLDALRSDSECMYSLKQMSVSKDDACKVAETVGLKDYDHLEAYRIYHAARLVAILESYAVYDQEIGYCQGMSDLLSPIVAVIDKDDDAFWCFVAFMKKARHNFRLDEAGIKRQLKMVSRIIKSKDSHLYRHLEKLQAEDCFFVYRMVVVLFRRELSFEQTLCLWEVIWADQAAVRAGIGKSAWGRIRPRAPPTDDLLLYAIAASVLQRRKLIIEKYSSMDEIVRECNSMSGHLDVWKLLDDAHDLVVSLHDKVS